MKLFFKLTFIIILGITIMAKTTTINLTELTKQLPGEISGWKKSSEETFKWKIYHDGTLGSTLLKEGFVQIIALLHH